MNENLDATKLLSFEWDANGEKLEIHGNYAGLTYLAEAIRLLLGSNGNDHMHLMTVEWGGSELSSECQNSEATLIKHVKIIRWR